MACDVTFFVTQFWVLKIICHSPSHRFHSHSLTAALKYTYVIYRLWGPYWEKLCPRSWVRPRAVLSRQRTQFLLIRTDVPRPVKSISIFVLLRFKSFRKILLQPPTYMFIEVWRVRVDEARDRLQTKTTHYNMIFSSLIYINIIKLSFRIKKGFCVLVDNS